MAVAHNAALTGKPGQVIATENEPSKALQARKNWKEAGDAVLQVIDLREGDLLETLKVDIPKEGIDLLLLDSTSHSYVLTFSAAHAPPLGTHSLGAHGFSNPQTRRAPPPSWSYDPH